MILKSIWKANTLTISSEKEDTKEQKEAKYSRKEYSYSSLAEVLHFLKMLRDKIDAKYDNGILTLMLSKKKNESISKQNDRSQIELRKISQVGYF